MTIDQNAPDAALLWADKNAQYGRARHYGVVAFRAGQARRADAGLLAALEGCVTVPTAETIGTIYKDGPELDGQQFGNFH